MRWSSENVRTDPDIWQYLKSSPPENERCKSGAIESTIECWLFPGSFHESLVWELEVSSNSILQSVDIIPQNDAFFPFWRFFAQVGDIFVFVFNQKFVKTHDTQKPTKNLG